MKPPVIGKMTITALRKNLQAKKFAVPKLQRNFVWDAGRAAKLLDSIYHGIPIGALFLWEMDKKSASLIRQSGDVLPPFSKENPVIWFVIDGQQRLSVIHRAFEAGEGTNDKGQKIFFFRLCLAVNPTQADQDVRPQRIVYRKPQEGEFISLSDILPADWKSRNPHRTRTLEKKIIECRERILNYPMPIITVKSATLDEIGEVFIRVNSQGMTISAVDKAIALMGEVDLRAMADNLRRRLSEKNFVLATIDPILMGFSLIENQRPILLTQNDLERRDNSKDPPKIVDMARQWSKRVAKDPEEKSRFTRTWDRYEKAFEKAVDYLMNNFCVFNEGFLPSSNMLATLAVFFHTSDARPTPSQKDEIRKWFWATGVAERYTGRGYHINIQNDANFFHALGCGNKRRFTFADFLDPRRDLETTTYSARSSRTRAFLCLLARCKPIDLENGSDITLSTSPISAANAKHRHHIFPQARMIKHFPAKVYNSLTNICFLISSDNTKIGKRKTALYMAEYKESNSKRFFKAMAANLVPVDEKSGIWERDEKRGFKKFKAARLKMICKAFETEAGIKLFKAE